MQNLQQQLDVKTRDLDRLTSLFDALYQATEIDASALLWQLRQGDGSIDSILALAEASQTRSMRWVCPAPGSRVGAGCQ